jgi:hypothetical protein
LYEIDDSKWRRSYPIPWQLRAWWAICRFFEGIKDTPRNCLYGIRNLVTYAPMIWGDRDWDFAYFLSLVELKLTRMAELMEKHGHHLNSEKDAKRMRLCVSLCKRLRKDDYLIEPTYFKNRYTKIRIGQSRRDCEYLFSLIGKHGLGWWD